MDEDTPLAWIGRVPAPFRPLCIDDLETPEQVEGLFNCCAVLDGHIEARGWRYLVQRFGISQLLKIDRAGAEWFWWDDDPEEARNNLLYSARISGYDPESDRFGEYEQMSGEFRPL